MKEINGMKYCPKCKETKPVSEYQRSWGTNDGYQVWCRDCMNAHQRARSAERRARNRARNLGEKAGG